MLLFGVVRHDKKLDFIGNRWCLVAAICFYFIKFIGYALSSFFYQYNEICGILGNSADVNFLNPGQTT